MIMGIPECLTQLLEVQYPEFKPFFTHLIDRFVILNNGFTNSYYQLIVFVDGKIH